MDAKWIYNTCKVGTKVTIYRSKSPGPLGKPSGIKVKYRGRTVLGSYGSGQPQSVLYPEEAGHHRIVEEKSDRSVRKQLQSEGLRVRQRSQHLHEPEILSEGQQGAALFGGEKQIRCRRFLDKETGNL